MSYNALDIIDKAIEIEHDREKILNDILHDNSKIPNQDIISKILSQEIHRRIEKYDLLKRTLIESSLEEIDVLTYDKISFLINEFNKRIYAAQINTIPDYLKFSLNLLQDKYALFIDIHGRLANSLIYENSKSYFVVSEIIKYIKEQINAIENLIHFVEN